MEVMEKVWSIFLRFEGIHGSEKWDEKVKQEHGCTCMSLTFLLVLAHFCFVLFCFFLKWVRASKLVAIVKVRVHHRWSHWSVISDAVQVGEGPPT